MEQIKKILEDYKGKLKEEKDSSCHQITLTSENVLQLNNPNDPRKERKVTCHINIFKTWNGEYNINYYEETYNILGGGCRTLPSGKERNEYIKHILERYNFQKKSGQVEQMRLF